ncbi:MAG: hypothetical protein KC419_00820 [Anaerolineales bacterium]|nr:hypothetical protein [Anaerolineales bacterium]MCA9926978.1 hypothetical protein [Anaerolineales bacterium]
MAKSSQNLSARCVDCNKVITFKTTPRLDQTVVCSHCDAMLAVVGLNPIELDWAYDDDFDDDDFDDDDFDYEDYEDYDDDED